MDRKSQQRQLFGALNLWFYAIWKILIKSSGGFLLDSLNFPRERNGNGDCTFFLTTYMFLTRIFEWVLDASSWFIIIGSDFHSWLVIARIAGFKPNLAEKGSPEIQIIVCFRKAGVIFQVFPLLHFLYVTIQATSLSARRKKFLNFHRHFDARSYSVAASGIVRMVIFIDG